MSFVPEHRIVRDDCHRQYIGRPIRRHSSHHARATANRRISNQNDQVRRVHADSLLELRRCTASDGYPLAPKRLPQRGLHRLALAYHEDRRPVLHIRHHQDGGRFCPISPAWCCRIFGYAPRHMTVHPIEFLREGFPKLFARGVEVLENRAAGGDERAQRILDDVKGVTGAASLQLTGEPPVVLSAREGALSSGEAPAQGVPIKITAALPGDAAQLLLGEVAKTGALDNDDVAIGAAQTASKRFEDALAGQPMTCHLTLRGVPDLGDVEVRIGFNVPEVPAEPGFTTELQFSDLETVQRGELTIQELFLGGKLKMEGDYSLALQIAMQLLTNPL
ncbi:MAG: hypothetical protein EP303_06685 [Deltaproteobacteria bacterium]|nr:MAG: hypothetical protein EP303_06685 [Deltaproteobacteria bacterium]